MPSNIFLHIGLPKTDTTFLQQAFFENRDQLAEEGISYPLPANSQWNAQHDFVRAFLNGGPDNVSVLFDECRLRIEGSDRLLMLLEEFAAWRGPNIQAWKTYLDHGFSSPGYRIYICIRRWADLAPSLWRQYVVSGGLSSFPEYTLNQFLQVQRNHPGSLDLRPSAAWQGQQGRLASPFVTSCAAATDGASRQPPLRSPKTLPRRAWQKVRRWLRAPRCSSARAALGAIQAGGLWTILVASKIQKITST